MAGTSPAMTTNGVKGPCLTISPSSAPGPAAMCAPSGRRSSASKSRWSRKIQRSAAPASISGASRRRRCCMPPSSTRKPGTSSGKRASGSARRGSVWRRLGAKVTVIEFLDRILPGMDLEVGKQFQRILQRQGMTFRLSSKVTGVDASGKKLKAKVEPAAGGAAETVEADIVLVAIGRVPYTAGLGLETVGVATDKGGRIIVDPHFATNVPGIFAIGDAIAGPMLAHKAEDEGIAVAELIAGRAGHVNYDAIPNVIYTFPEVASIGKTEEELKAAGVEY